MKIVPFFFTNTLQMKKLFYLLLLMTMTGWVYGQDASTLTLEIDGGQVQVRVPQANPGPEGGAPFRALAFINVSQFAAHINFPKSGKPGYQLYFAVDMSIGGRQASLLYNGRVIRGVYLIADLLDQGERARPGEIGKSFDRGKLLCLGIYPNGREFKYPPNGSTGFVQN
jgi:hypothetical protein